MASSKVPLSKLLIAAKRRLIVGAIALTGGVSVALLIDRSEGVKNSDQDLNHRENEVYPSAILESSSSSQPLTASLATDISEVPEAIRTLLDRPGELLQMDSIVHFARSREGSAFAPILLLRAGEELYESGCYTDSLTTLEEAWTMILACSVEHWTEHKLLAKIAARLGELYARLGRMEELEKLLAEMEKRPIEGAETLAFTNLHQASESMRDFPEHSFKCGPLALGKVISTLRPASEYPRCIAEIASPTRGFSLAEVVKIGDEIGFPVKAVRPGEGQIPLPSVVHWRSEHYAAITQFNEGRYLVEDPTFQRSVWMSPEALRRESSGFFVVPADRVDPAWSLASADQAAATFGKGAPKYKDDNDQGGDEEETACKGLPVAGFNNFYAALTIRDIPLFYTPPVGPAVEAELTYFDLSKYDNVSAKHGHPGKKWLLGWSRHIRVEMLNTAGATFEVVRANGRMETFKAVVSGGVMAVAARGIHTRSRLKVAGGVSGTPVTNVTKTLPDGSNETYGYLGSGGNSQAFGAVVGGGTKGSQLYLAALTDPQGNALRFRYAPGTAKLKGVVDAIGQETTIHYSDSPDGMGADNPTRRMISAIRDPFGRVVRFSYDAQERLTSLTDVAGIKTTFAYDVPEKPDFITSMKTPYGKSSFAKSSDDNNLTLTDPMGLQEKVSFAMRRDLVLPGVSGAKAVPAETPATADVAIANGQAYYGYLYYGTTLYWDKKTMRMFGDQVDKAHQTRWSEKTTGHLYVTGIPSSRRPALSHRTWYHYEGQPNPGTMGISAQPTLSIRRIKDQNGNPADEIRRYAYNANGHLTRTVDPLGREIEYQYEANGIDLKAVRRKRGTAYETLTTFSGYGHDAPHRPRFVTDAAGQTTELRWNARGQLTRTINPLGQRTVNTYDANGYLTRVESTHPAQPASLVTRSTFLYDAMGRPRRITGSDGYSVDLEYDALNRPVKTTYPDGTWESVTYQHLSAVSVRDRLGRVTSHTYNANRQRISTTDPAGRTLKFEWCSCGALQVLIDAMNRSTRWQYDHMGRQVAKIYADGSRETYGYDAASGRLETVTDAKGNVKTHAYYLDGQPASRRYNQPNTPQVTFAYNAADGLLTSMTDGGGTTTYAYHPTTSGTLGAGRLASVDGPWANDTIAYSYDQLGRIAQRNIGGVSESFSFDATGRPTGVSNQLGSFAIGYDGVTSRVLSLTHSGGQKTEYSYLPAAQDFRLQRIRHLKPDGTTPLSVFDYTYDPVGRILSWRQQEGTATAQARTWAFGYDDADQLKSAVATQGSATVQSYGWSYDPAGNRLTQTLDGATATSSYNALNELIHTTATLPAQTYEWDAEDRLLAINRGTLRTEFTYDGLGRRVRLVEKQNGSVVSTQSYLWEGLSIREQRDANGSTVRQRYFGGGCVDLTGGSPQSYLQTTDHLGSIRETTDTAGNLVQRVSYNLWGNPSFATGAATSPFAFTGHFWHAESGLHLAPYRAYAAATGRWISRDPIGEAGGVNLFNYSLNRPQSLVDPTGKLPSNWNNHPNSPMWNFIVDPNINYDSAIADSPYVRQERQGSCWMAGLLLNGEDSPLDNGGDPARFIVTSLRDSLIDEFLKKKVMSAWSCLRIGAVMYDCWQSDGYAYTIPRTTEVNAYKPNVYPGADLNRAASSSQSISTGRLEEVRNYANRIFREIPIIPIQRKPASLEKF